MVYLKTAELLGLVNVKPRDKEINITYPDTTNDKKRKLGGLNRKSSSRVKRKSRKISSQK